MKPTLLVLAAGMATRYGSMKQIQGFGPGGETLMDYSIYDAIRAGFGKVVFIIRKDFETTFKEIFEPKLNGKIKTEYVFQEMNSFLPEGFSVPAERTKPWGTAPAVLCAKEVIHEPFAVINADDFYGREAFEKAAKFLNDECNAQKYAVLGYELEKTLSPNGSVSRGVCSADDKGNLSGITERTKIYKENGNIVYEDGDKKYPLDAATPVSMNFWAFDPSVFDLSLKLFHEFVKNNIANPKAEFFIPIVIDYYIAQNSGIVKIISTSEQWFGVTYKEDAPGVAASFKQLVNEKIYPEYLWK